MTKPVNSYVAANESNVIPAAAYESTPPPMIVKRQPLCDLNSQFFLFRDLHCTLT